MSVVRHPTAFVPERGIRDRDLQIELPGPSVRTPFTKARIIRGHHRERYRKQIPSSRCRLQPPAQELMLRRVTGAATVAAAGLTEQHDP